MGYVRKHRDITLVRTERGRNCLVSEPNYYTTKFFPENVLVIEMKKMQILVNKPVYFRLSILELSKILMYKFWYDYVKLKYGEKSKLCYMNRDSFTVYIKTDNTNKDIVDVETRFDTSNYELDTSNYELDSPLPKTKNKKVIGLMKDESGGKIMTKFAGLRSKISYSSLIDDSIEDKKAKGTKLCIIKRKLKFENYKNCLEATQLENKIK